MKYKKMHIILTAAALVISILSMAMTRDISNDRQSFDMKLTKDVIERQLLLDAKRKIISNASKVNVIALVDIIGKQPDREIIKEALTYHTENIFHYFSIRDSLSEYSSVMVQSKVEF